MREHTEDKTCALLLEFGADNFSEMTLTPGVWEGYPAMKITDASTGVGGVNTLVMVFKHPASWAAFSEMCAMTNANVMEDGRFLSFGELMTNMGEGKH